MGRFQSMRSRLLLAMVLPALVAIVVGFVLYTHVEQMDEHALDQKGAQAVADGLAHQFAIRSALPDRGTLQTALPNDEVLISRNGQTVLSTHLADIAQRRLELTAVSGSFGGAVTIRDYTAVGDTGLSDELIAVAAVPALLLVFSAVTATSYLSGALRRQVGNARHAADRITAGDLGACMGTDARGEFVPLASAFDGMATRLETSDRNQRQFLGDLAHELATPVTAISANGLALADGTASGDQARERAAATVTRETRRLQGLLADLRNLTTLDLAQTVHQGPVAIDQLCREVTERFAQSARAAGVRLSVRGSDVDAVSDGRLIDMVVSNLVSNAIRYTPQGGQVRVEVRRHRDEIVVCVRDTGIGIAPDQQQRIFDRFYRVDEARQRATGGTGLGLSLARRAAEQLHGRIEVSSEPGRGSTFRLVFPVRPRSSSVLPAL